MQNLKSFLPAAYLASEAEAIHITLLTYSPASSSSIKAASNTEKRN